MPKSKHRRNGKNRTTAKAPARQPAANRKHPTLYDRTCPTDLLVAEFGEDGTDWLLAEYERPLNLADLELEKAIRAGELTMDHPLRGPKNYPLAKVSRTLWTTTELVISLARVAGVMTPAELEEVGEPLEIDHGEDGPSNLRAAHWDGGLYLNSRGYWNFGA